jgi:hypothetical protein
LTNPKTIDVDPQYIGCKSWLNLKQPIKGTDYEPVLSDVQFSAIRQEIHDVLGIHSKGHGHQTKGNDKHHC